MMDLGQSANRETTAVPRSQERKDFSPRALDLAETLGKPHEGRGRKSRTIAGEGELATDISLEFVESRPSTLKRRVQPSNTMAEPPTKRARRTDSAAMWEDNDGNASPRSYASKPSHHEREDRRRSTSRDRDRYERRRDRSRSKDRGYRDRDRDRDRGREYRGGRDSYDRRDRDRRSRSRDRHGSRRDIPSKPIRERSRSPQRNGTSIRTRSPPRGSRSDRPKNEAEDGGKAKGDKRNGDAMQVDKTNGNHEVEDEEDEDALLRKVMGFSSFNTTQNKKVPGNDVYGVRKEKKTEYRQYMNRVGGFNRPLSPGR